ncbi:head maturation protease, ClpP-related [Ketogulonicigenium vulgare]|uniref:head maturation protease, ClpP-related n=1 Tax=Ketogulonicigenium vulgare TaxID=92945 RepID=UPI002358D39E|nr:head maturation protease, ClpP-related [Ketogulonicigenium vulgare]
MNEIFLTGTVGQSFWDEEYFTATSVRALLAEASGPLTVHINSGGGIASEGQAIYALLKDYADEVTVVVDGIAASAASLIAMAGDQIVMPMGSILMIHDPASWAVAGRGTEDDHLKAAKDLRVIANAYAAVYAARAGISPSAAREIMRAETYYDGDAAVDAGFATSTDDGAAAAAALFDYRIYAHAPAALRAVGDALGQRPSKRAIAAMMAGTINFKQEAKMPNTRASRAKAAKMEDQDTDLEEELDPTLEGEDEDPTAELEDDPEALEEEGDPAAEEGEDDPTAEGEDDPDEELKEAMRVTAVLKLCKKKGISTAVAHHYIAAGMSAADVRRLMPMNKDGRMPKTTAFTPRARIMRDERDTRREAITGALFAKMQEKRGRKPEVSAASRQYMAAGLIEMAAEATGQRLPRFGMSSYGTREKFMMEAMHSTSDFPAIFQNALHKVLLDTYSNFTPTYQRVAERKDFNDFRPMPLVLTGNLPMLKPITETGEIQSGTFSDRGELALIERYGVIVPIDRAMIVNDELDAIARVMERYGRTVGVFEERTFYSLAFSGLMSDGKPIFHTDHNNLAAAASAITDDAVSEARTSLREAKDLDGDPLYLNPNLLVVGPKNETAAQRLLAQTTPANADDVNIFSGQLSLVVTPEINGKEWYVFDDTNPCWTYGYLEGAAAPRVSTQELFDQQGMKLKLEHDFGVGHARYESGFKNPGL